MPLKVKNLAQVHRRLATMPPAITNNVKRAIESSAIKMVREVKKELSRVPAVPHLTQRGRMQVYMASPAGGPPAIQTGELMRSVKWYFKAGTHRLTAIVTAGTFAKLSYAKVLEFGLAGVAARPFFYPTWFRLRPAIAKRIRSAVRGAYRKARQSLSITVSGEASE